VLLETHRYQHALGVDDANSVRVLGIFHAPLGFVVTGFGLLALVLAAPLDNYWHGLYGLDVMIWAPFHVMGLLGVIIARLGGVYLWSALQVQARQAEGDPARIGLEGWAGLFTLMMMLGDLLTLAAPAVLQDPTTDLGPLRVMTYTVLLALFVPWLLRAAYGVVARPGAATLVMVLLLLRDLVLQLSVPWLVRTGAALEGASFRLLSAPPSFLGAPLGRDACLLLVALLLDLLLRSGSAHTGRWHAHPLAIRLGPALALWLVGALFVGLVGWHEAALLSLPFALAAAFLSSQVGEGLAEILRLNTR